MTLLFVAIAILLLALVLQRQIRFICNVSLWKIPFYRGISAESFRSLKKPVVRTGLSTFFLNESEMDSQVMVRLSSEKSDMESWIRIWPDPLKRMIDQSMYCDCLPCVFWANLIDKAMAQQS